jgi:hypothetical protein
MVNTMVENDKANTITVRVNNHIITWTNGTLSGDKELVEQAKYMDSFSELVFFPVTTVSAEISNPRNPAGALAAMWGISPDRASVEQCDPELKLELFGVPE